MLRKYSVAVSRQGLLSRQVHTTQQTLATTPAWFHSLMGDQASIRKQFETNRNKLLANFPKKHGFDSIHELLNKSHFDKEGEKLQAELSTLQSHPNTKPLIDAAGVFAKQSNFKLIYVNAFLYHKDYDYLSRDMLRKWQFTKLYRYASSYRSLYIPKHNALLIKRWDNEKLSMDLFSQFTTILHTSILDLPDQPTIEDIKLARVSENAKTTLEQQNIPQLTDELVEPFSDRLVSEAIQNHFNKHSQFFHHALETDHSNATTHNQNYMDGILTAMLLNMANASNAIPTFSIMYQLYYLSSHLSPPEVQEVIHGLFPFTIATAHEFITENCKRYVIRDEIAPKIISDLKNKLNTAQGEILEELLNEKNLIEPLQSSKKQKAIKSVVAKQFRLFPNTNKETLREKIKPLLPNKPSL